MGSRFPLTRDVLLQPWAGRSRTWAAAIALIVGLAPARVNAEWQITPFAAVTFSGETTIIDLEQATGEPKLTFGATVGWVGSSIFGLEGEFAYVHKFFERAKAQGALTPELDDDIPDDFVLRSRIVTLSGRAILTLPRRLTEYSLRPFASGGVAMMRVTSIDGKAGVPQPPIFPVQATLPALDLGGGVTGFFDRRRGMRLELRYLRVIGGELDEALLERGALNLSYWRAAAGFVFRY